MIDSLFMPEHVFKIALGLFTLLLLVGAFLLFRKRPEPYERLDSILTPAEQRFYQALSSALQGRVLIMAKVRIADIIKVRRSSYGKNFWRHFSRISQKHIDFVLIDPKTFTTLCLIELDDKSHTRYNRINRDKFVNQVMVQTGIPLYRFPVRRRYNHAKLLETLKL